MQADAQEGVQHLPDKQGISGAYTDQPFGLLAFWLCVEKYHPLADFKPEEWKKLQIPTEYYTCNLHTGAFMLPKYVEELLEEEEKR